MRRLLPLHAFNCVIYKPPVSKARSEYTFHLGDLSGQSDHLAKSVVVARRRLSQLHVSALQALVEDIHDLGSDVTNIRILFVTLYQHPRNFKSQMKGLFVLTSVSMFDTIVPSHSRRISTLVVKLDVIAAETESATSEETCCRYSGFKNLKRLSNSSAWLLDCSHSIVAC